jgi:phage repressor protein C with HTH and peptisase S24 domain
MRNIFEIRNLWFIKQVGKLEKDGNSRAEIARRLNVLPQYLTPLLSGSRNVSEKFIKKFCTAFDINQNDLLRAMLEYESPEVLKGVNEPLSIAKTKTIADDPSRIPLVSVAAVAGFGNADFAIKKEDIKDYYVVPKFKDRRIDFMIEVSGSSMYPKYSSGDVVACTILRESKFIQWNKVHLIGTVEQGILIKRVKKGEDEHHLLLISDNKDYDPFMISLEEVTGMALVVGVIRLE